MLTVTENASKVVKDIAEQHSAPDDGGVHQQSGR